MLNKPILIVLLGAYAAVARPSQSPSATLQLSAKGDPYVFAMVLADASIPSGVVIRESMRQRPRGRPDFVSTSGSRVAPEELVKILNAYHQQYQAAVVDD